MHAKSLWSCPTLCNPMDCSSLGSSVHGILQARILEWDAMPSSRESFLLNPHLLWLLPHRQFFITKPPEKPHSFSKHPVNRVCESESVTIWDPMDWSLPSSSIHGIFQARGLEWVAISFSRGSFRPRDWTQVSYTAGRFFPNWATREAHSLTKE